MMATHDLSLGQKQSLSRIERILRAQLKRVPATPPDYAQRGSAALSDDAKIAIDAQNGIRKALSLIESLETATTPSQAVIDTLGAIEVEPGYYAWLTSTRQGQRYHVLPAGTLAELSRLGDWRHIVGIEMPAWWTLECREVCRYCHKPYATYHSANQSMCSSQPATGDFTNYHGVSIDIESGTEIPAR